MDTVRVNSQTVFFLNQDKDPRKQDSWEFGWNLAKALIMPYMERRRNSPGITKTLLSTIDRVYVPELALGVHGPVGQPVDVDVAADGDPGQG